MPLNSLPPDVLKLCVLFGQNKTILSGHVDVEEVLLFNNFFPDCRYVP